ncbi:MAG: ZIP family metal transporter [Lautropia sp.]
MNTADRTRTSAAFRRPTPAGLRRLVGWLIVVTGGIVLLQDLWSGWRAIADDPIGLALWGGSVAALATALGALPMLSTRRQSDRTLDTLLGFGAGVMLAACAFSLVVPGLAVAGRLGLDRLQSAALVGTGILIGGLLMLAIDRWLPHEHFIKGVEGGHGQRLRRVWLFVFAICLHNLPEGLAIGVAFAGDDPAGGAALATGIAIQDVPEGLVVALALRAVGYGRAAAVGIAVASGLIEPVGAVAGAAIVGLSATLLPWGLAFAAGAMLFVISHEIIPESHRKGHERFATAGLVVGFVAMMVLDTALG